MARSDLVIDLIEAQRRGDVACFRVLVEAIIAEERSNQHHLVADRLSELITTAGSTELLTRDDCTRPMADPLHEIVPRRRLVAVQRTGRSAPTWSISGDEVVSTLAAGQLKGPRTA